MQPQWQVLLDHGNDCFLQGEWTGAEGYYEQAFDLLNQAKRALPTCTDTFMAWIGTCHNLAAVYECQCELEQAFNYLQLPYNHCQHQIQTRESEEMVLISLKSLNLAWSAILLFGKNHPEFIKNQPIAQDLAHSIDRSFAQFH